MGMTEKKTVKIQYCRTRKAKDGDTSKNCRVPLTKSLIEQMGFYEGCSVNVEYDIFNDKIILSLAE